MKIAIVIPCFNVEKHIDSVLTSIPDHVKWVICVDDCSTDKTDILIRDNISKTNKIKCVTHTQNLGVGGAMKSGYKQAIDLGADIIVKMDGDGQMNPDYLEKLIKPILENEADFTKGNRFRDFKALRSMPLGRRVGNLGLSFIIKAASGYWNIFDPTNGFTAISRLTLEKLDFEKIHQRYYFETSMLIELYLNNAVVKDVSMAAKYGDEVSGLSISQSLIQFPPKLFIAWVKRIVLKYFLFDFNIASLYILIGTPMFLYGIGFGVINYFKYVPNGIAAPTGTILIPTLLIILGFQLLLSALSYDLTNFPKK